MQDLSRFGSLVLITNHVWKSQRSFVIEPLNRHWTLNLVAYRYAHLCKNSVNSTFSLENYFKMSIMFFFSSWRYIQGPCSVSCGGGIAKRVLFCSQRMEEYDGNNDLVVGETACDCLPRPSEVVECNTENCQAR